MSFDEEKARRKRAQKIPIYEETLEEFENDGRCVPLQTAYLRLLKRIGVGRAFEVVSWTDYWAVKRACKLSGYAIRVKICRTRTGVFRVLRIV